MAADKKVPEFCVKALLDAGMDQAVCNLAFTRKTELNVEAGNISLLRTTDDVSLSLTGIKEMKKASSSINKIDEESIKKSVQEVVEFVNASETDPANGIAELQPPESFTKGSEKPDVDLMYKRMKSFLAYTTKKYPTLTLEQVILDHSAQHRYYNNSNEVDFKSVRGGYSIMLMFISKKGTDISSFNYIVVAMNDLSDELYNYDGIDRLLAQSVQQVTTENMQGNFVGDVIITPECMGSFVSIITSYLGDYPLITGTSIYKDSLDKLIADEKFTLHSTPISKELTTGYFFTGDGYKVKNSTIIDNGVLKTFLLGLYGSRKTGLEKAVNSGGCYVVDQGDSSFEEMVKSVKKGILLCRFSGGNPSSNGDFSGVAKNSYYIENGKIMYPITETMVSGNLKEMMKNIKSISSERVNNGNSILPWITFSGVSVSGK